MRSFFLCLAVSGVVALTACAQQKAALTAASPGKSEAWYINEAPFKMATPVLPQFAARTVSITEFGARGDGHTLNTEAFAKAINACAAAGGGRVVVPAGLWLTGPIEFRSGINLVVERGALLQFSADHTQYPIVKPGGSSNYSVTAPIYGYKLRNVAITGEGIIDGAGDSWRPVKKNKVTAAQWKDLQARGGAVSTDGSIWWPSKEAMEGEEYLKTLKGKTGVTAADYAPARTFLRPHMVQFSNCENVLVESITIRNSPKFVFYPTGCNNLTMRHVTIFNEWWAQNGDGIDISACKNVLLYKCTVSAGDDGICMKSSGMSADGGPKLENVVVAASTVYHGHGGFVIGSNTDGGMNNIFVADCNFIGTDIGIRVKSNAGRGGLVRNVFIRDVFMSDIQDEAVSFDTYYEDVPAGAQRGAAQPATEKVPDLRDFTITNLYCRGAKTAIAITGLPGAPVQNIRFQNVLISAAKAYTAQNATAISFTNSKVLLPGGAEQDLAAPAR
ncbi:MAG: glycoside hydrolase family 28 protein [Chitinophagaceae bacterium]|nr:MAG: glycoside hydrolase family 28 protein [Chitinophagaceae bacterium]